MRIVSFMVIMASMLFACNGERDPAYERAGVDLRYQAIYDLTQDLSCTDSGVCLSIGIGAKPCGGAWLNLVYSSATGSAEKLDVAVAELSAYEAGYNQQEGLASDCGLPPPANPSCVNNTCVDLNATQ